MSTLTALLRVVAMTPITILRSTQTKLSVLLAGVMGLTVGADARVMGREPVAVFDEVRREMITENGQLVEQEPREPATAFGRRVDDMLVNESPDILTAPESWNTALEQTLIVPMLRATLSVAEVTAGIGYWLSGFLPALVIKVVGLGAVLAAMVVYLASFREVAE